MKKINWIKLVARADWELTLADIMEYARKSVSDKDADGVEAVRQLLNKFIDASPPEQWWSTDLDDLARDALAVLLVDVITATNDDLASRSEQLRRIAKAVGGMVSENDRVAADMRHEKLTQALVSAINAAKAAKELQAVVKDNVDDKAIADMAVALVETVAKFKDALSKSDAGD
jgi:hypothetical protein